MEKSIEILSKSLKVSTESLQHIAEETTGLNGMLLNSVIDTLQAQQKVVEYLSNCLDTEMSIKNRCFDFLCKKGLMDEFYSK